MHEHAEVKLVVLCAALLLAPAAAQAQSPEPALRATAPEAGAPVPADVAAVPVAPAAPPPDPVAEAFAALDRDADGKVSSVEHAEAAKARFDALDADHNYHLSAAEMRRATATGGTVSGQAVTPTAGANDDNDNGEISPEENRVEAEAQFRARDADRDGSLSLEEMRSPVAPVD